MNIIKKSIQVIMSFFIVLIVLAGSQSVFADEANYQSNSGVGFYGEYEFPTDPSIEPPTIPEPGPVPPGGGTFPQTGEANKNFFSIGSLFLVVAFGMGINIKNKKLKGEIK